MQRLEDDGGFLAHRHALTRLGLTRLAQQGLQCRCFGRTVPVIKPVPFTEYRQAMADGVVGQSPGFGFDLCRDKCSVDARRQKVHPFAIGRRACQVVNHKLHGHRGRQGRITQRLAVAQLQPGGPVAESAAVAAHGIGRSTGGDERSCRFLGVGRQKMQIQRRFANQRQLICNI
ncbi:hypothetical protein D3C84_669860 [compost metagenome]